MSRVFPKKTRHGTRRDNAGRPGTPRTCEVERSGSGRVEAGRWACPDFQPTLVAFMFVLPSLGLGVACLSPPALDVGAMRRHLNFFVAWFCIFSIKNRKSKIKNDFPSTHRFSPIMSCRATNKFSIWRFHFLTGMSCALYLPGKRASRSFRVHSPLTSLTGRG
jgi:hypothetical protein